MIYKNLQVTSYILISLFVIVAGISVGANFFIPFFAAIFIATLVRPVCEFFERMGLPLIISALITDIIVFVIVTGFMLIIINQLQIFLKDMKQIEQSLRFFLRAVQNSIEAATGVSQQEQIEFLQGRAKEISSILENAARGFINDAFTTLLHFLLVLVYNFLFLVNRGKYVEFVLQMVDPENVENAKEIIYKGSYVAHHYLWGRIQVMSILAVMYIITFLAFGVQHAILLTIIGALLTIIPYIGPWLSGTLPVISSLLMGMDTNTLIWLAIVIFIVQMIESYILEPIFMGAEVQLSPLMIIISIILGGIIWDIPGMILFVPMIAVFKIIADHIEPLKPVGLLLGYTGKKPGESVIKKVKNIFNR